MILVQTTKEGFAGDQGGGSSSGRGAPHDPTPQPACARVCSQLNVLVVGGGGREHSLVWRLAQSESSKHVFAAPGNPGTAQEANVTNVAVDVTKHKDVSSPPLPPQQP